MKPNTCTFGDCRETMRGWPDGIAQMCVTSPPYLGLRDYGVLGQLGHEKTPEEYTENMVEVFREVKRLLKEDGTLWLNLGDSFASTLKGSSGINSKQLSNVGGFYSAKFDLSDSNLKLKDLIGIPWRVAFALQADGWYLRSDIIWHKPNPMPESVLDRPTRSHEYIFLLSKSEKYFYDAAAIREPAQDPSGEARKARAKVGQKSNPTDERNGTRPLTDKQRGHSPRHAGFNARWDKMSKEEQQEMGRNKRDVWSIATSPYDGAHFATLPPDLIKPCILAGSRPGDTVLDPFFGSGTTGEVSQLLGRNWLGCELNPEYWKLQEKRTVQLGMVF